MYSRYYGNRQEEVHLPENYSGCAFSKGSAEKERVPSPPMPPIPHDLPPIKKPPADPPPMKKPTEDPPPVILPPPKEPEEEVQTPPPAPAPPPPLPSPTPRGGLLSQWTGALDFDQLLIMGLILLLLHNGEDNEIVLWLVLLLFC